MPRRYKVYILVCSVLYSFNVLYPQVVYDVSVHYAHIAKFYPWMQFPIYVKVFYLSRKYFVDMNDVFAIIHHESQGNQYARSVANARGLMQVMPVHYFGDADDLYDIDLNLELGVRYFRWCLDYCKNSKECALRCYNAGPYYPKWKYKNALYVNGIINKSFATSKLFELPIIVY